jgi:beta-galactosidase
MIDGKRKMIYSGEFEYWRLPSPSLWKDVLQKMKSSGFNAVTIYFDWGYHSPKKGVYDFTGTRNVDKLLHMAQKAGLYVIARPGPYINAETDVGGFPDWLTTEKGKARSSDANYTKYYTEWLNHINPILAKHQITNGGNVIMYQVENEYTSNDTSYMQNIIDVAHKDGINVPTFHNDKTGPSGRWSSGTGAPDMYAFDRYPNIPGIDGLNNFEDPHTKGFAKNSPIFLAELGNGWFDPWNGKGYASWRNTMNANEENVVYKHIIGEGATVLSYYMTYGGTNWGNLAFPGVYTSYDYASAINEERQIDDKLAQQKKIAYMLNAVEPYAKTDNKYEGTLATNNNIRLIQRENPDTKTEFYTVRHIASKTTSTDTFDLPIKTADVNTEVPVTLNGQKSKVIIANYNFGNEHMVYSTGEIFTNFSHDGKDTTVIYNANGDKNETVFKYNSKPKVTTLSGDVTCRWDDKTKTLSLTNNYKGLAQVHIKTDKQDFTLFLGTDDDVDQMWQKQTNAGPVLIKGPYLTRTARVVKHNTLALTGDTDKQTDVAVYAPASVKKVIWNRKHLRVTKKNGLLSGSLDGPNKSAVKLPKLTWKVKSASPESQATFDDSKWIAANKTSSNSITKPETTPVLFEDDYGFHHGDVWYRGHFKATGNETGIKLNGQIGNYGAYSVWLNGKSLGSAEAGATASKEQTFNFDPSDLKKGDDNVVSVLVANMGHDEDGNSNDAFKAARGLIGASLQGTDVDKEAITWKLQGNAGGENIADTARGSYNLGGLYGEREGWSLPGYTDRHWQSVMLPDKQKTAGVAWYRSDFKLNIPKNYDVPISLKIDDSTFRQANGAAYRAYIYVNGWQYGQYINNVGPQNEFYLPAGLLNEQGHNTISIAVWSLDDQSAQLGSVSLKIDGIYDSALHVDQTAAPNYQDLYHKRDVATSTVKVTDR